ncbi:energy transducer TonB [Saccharibacter sp. 17.LH.SD]|nr:energy transducer TonB [Saccharibacter sp. 17.LH.SD]
MVFSVLLHGGILVALVWHWTKAPPPLPEPPPETPVNMVFEPLPATSAPKAQRKSSVPAPRAPVETKVYHPSPTPPARRAPPPPPPPPAQAAPVVHHTPVVAPVHQRAELQEKGEVSEKPKPSVKAQPQPAQVKAPAKKVEKPPQKPQPSQTEQPHETPKAQANSHSLLATLDSFREEENKTPEVHKKAGPPQGGSPRGGGSPDADTRALSRGEQSAIGSSVQRCYQEDTAARNYAHFEAHLLVTVDAAGEARLVSFAPETRARMVSDPSYRAQAERARDAVLSPVCARLPIPARMRGQRRQFRFVFRP